MQQDNSNSIQESVISMNYFKVQKQEALITTCKLYGKSKQTTYSVIVVNFSSSYNSKTDIFFQKTKQSKYLQNNKQKKSQFVFSQT